MIINSHFEGSSSSYGSSHPRLLSAGDGPEGRANRRMNFQNTLTKLTIPHDFVKRTAPVNKNLSAVLLGSNLKRSDSASSLESASRSLQPDMTKSCDCVLWAGDLNFRVDMTYDQVVSQCNQRHFTSILDNDEFLLQRKKIG